MRTRTTMRTPDLFDVQAPAPRPTKCWIAVASADHVRRGVEDSIVQVCHGKAGPLRRISPGDRLAYYSPSTVMRGADKLQAFTAYGRVKNGEPYLFDMGDGFRPYRRDVAWERAWTTPIRPLLDALAFTSGDRNWGYKLRFGLFDIGAADMDVIAAAMGAGPTSRPAQGFTPVALALPQASPTANRLGAP